MPTTRNEKPSVFGEAHAAVISDMRTWRVNSKHDFAYPLDEYFQEHIERLREAAWILTMALDRAGGMRPSEVERIRELLAEAPAGKD